ncbi:DNA-binding domain-containing protein [Nitrospirillum sp. BR 11828]|uniref:DNA-binding domain-containing protein n=1 Tax=Nitrospirillum sp. BR 11828 TaxID=3104325 RepID=UPI002ACA03FF|nr:DNA-binding domain-containing protein [Nitrospirillum sp. BR 11828]MDZ5650430.1 DNA-binding domain-containing protein [Nitrospirillum sp. BR 11828]
MLEAFQAQMRRALLAPAGGASGTGVDLAVGPVAEARLKIYRANVQQSLAEALAAAFPITLRLMGVPAFRAAALDFVRAHPPTRPQLSAYGGDFPAALVPLDAGAADMARLEWAVMEAYFAADAAALTAAQLAAFPPGDYAQLRFTAHPAARIVWLRHDVLPLWRQAQADEALALSAPQPAAGEVLVLRPADGIVCVALPPGAAAAIQSLLDGETLEQAAAAGLAVEPALNLQAMLHMLLAQGALAGASL